MKLATRFSAFFLTALAAVLVGFSVSLYLLASNYLYGQLDDRVAAGLDVLEGSIDVEPGGLEWEPAERRILIGAEHDAESVRWSVLTLEGKLVDQSANGPPPGFADWRPEGWPTDPPDATVFGDSGVWRMGTRRLLLEDLLRLGRGHPKDDGGENDIEYLGLIVLAGLEREPAVADLRSLATTLAVISLGLWLACAGLGRWLSRNALAPVTQMAEDVRQLRVTDAELISLPGTGDELDDLAAAFNELVVRLREAIERRERFAGDASHQLRTPITGLLAQLEVLRRRPREASEYAAGLDEIQGEALRMRQIVESLMFLARSDADALPLERENIDLAEWLPKQRERWQSHARAGDLRLELTGGECVVAVHSGLLGELLDNLTDNALKYSQPAQRVTWRVESDAGDVRLIVADEGPGIAAEELAHVFEPFYRSPKARAENRRGVGLGLTIVQRIVKTLGARIEVTSAAGQGTRFAVTFARHGDTGA